MIKHLSYRIFAISMIILLYGTCFIPLSNTQIVNQYYDQPQKTINGLILFGPIYSLKTYLIDKTGAIYHTWSSNNFPGESVYWLDNGTILRAIKVNLTGLGGSGGGVQKILWDGTITWDFTYCTNEHQSHHDIEPLPNGNVLIIAFEKKTQTEIIAAGGNPKNYIADTYLPDYIIEVKPTGLTTGDIVWEWHYWDHLIQDYDSLKDNYGIVGNHPELVDINYIPHPAIDLMHTNSIDYNEKFDQILISVRNYNEIWVIDHSTTTEDATSHNGGNSGKGGDLLYRWGNPAAYRAGNPSNQKLFQQHDAKWIDEGCPGAGNILVFNNGIKRPDGDFSSVDEIIPPIDENHEYYLETGSAYGPIEQTCIYTANPPESLYSRGQSGAERLANGNTIICSGEQEKIFEVTPYSTTLWTYTNTYPTLLRNKLFKFVYIPLEEVPDQPPNKPTITGETNGKIGQNYTYITSTIDPNGDQVYYNWSWGDGTYTGWIGLYDSGKTVSQSHSWNSKGSYSVKVQAKDVSGAESDWSLPLEVNMPKTYVYNPLMRLIFKVLERFPFFEKILKQIIL